MTTVMQREVLPFLRGGVGEPRARPDARRGPGPSPPPDALAGRGDLDIIFPELAPTLPRLFRERVRRSSAAVAYSERDAGGGWIDHTWGETQGEVDRWISAFRREGLKAGERVAIRLHNGWRWVVSDQAALACGLVVVPIYLEDQPDNIAYAIERTEARLLLVPDAARWRELVPEGSRLGSLRRVVVAEGPVAEGDPRVVTAERWLARGVPDSSPAELPREGNALATIVFTSGTTGRPKGVMLSHRNILEDARGGLHSIAVKPDDHLLSFLPLSHMLERTVGYYLPMMAGARVTFNRAIPELAGDLQSVRPTILVTVPRVFEKAHRGIMEKLEEGPAPGRWIFERAVATGWRRFEYRQGRASWHPCLPAWPLLDALVGARVRRRFGGRLRLVVCGGAALSGAVSRVFIGLGIPILQGYGLTETSPVLTVNTPGENRPETIGRPLRGVELRVDGRGELLARGAPVMLGYWRDKEATRGIIDSRGWLHTGDCARIEGDFVRLTGRIKEIIVLANGEKVPPADMESAICRDPLFEQALVVGEGRPFLAALVVLDRRRWRRLAAHLGLDPEDEARLREPLAERTLLKRLAACLVEFPGYARIHRLTATLQPWTRESGALTPTLKLRRAVLQERFSAEIERMYAGH